MAFTNRRRQTRPKNAAERSGRDRFGNYPLRPVVLIVDDHTTRGLTSMAGDLIAAIRSLPACARRCEPRLLDDAAACARRGHEADATSIRALCAVSGASLANAQMRDDSRLASQGSGDGRRIHRPPTPIQVAITAGRRWHLTRALKMKACSSRGRNPKIPTPSGPWRPALDSGTGMFTAPQIEAPRVQLTNGLCGTKERPTSLPTAPPA